MIKYDLLSWFRKTRMNDGKTLYCDRPGCNKTVLDSELIFCPEDRTLFHPGYCLTIIKAENSKTPNAYGFRSYETISRENALEFLKDGKLRQSKGLERKL